MERVFRLVVMESGAGRNIGTMDSSAQAVVDIFTFIFQLEHGACFIIPAVCHDRPGPHSGDEEEGDADVGEKASKTPDELAAAESSSGLMFFPGVVRWRQLLSHPAP